MINESSAWQLLQRLYPCLVSLPGPMVPATHSPDLHELNASPGDLLYGQNAPCHGFPLLLDGEVAVSRSDADSGRSMELYRVHPGDICIISSSSLLAHTPLQAQAVAVTHTRLVLLPPRLFEEWTAWAPFRQFVFGVFAERIADLTNLIDAIAFQRLDRRLADHLLGHGTTLRATHQSLADELGTVRRIVTRLLNRFEADGLVRLGRERIDVTDVHGLRDVASGRPVQPRSPTAPGGAQ